MNTSQTPFLPDPASGEPISPGRLAYLQERTRNLLFEFVLNKFVEAEKAGLTKAELARRTHHSPSVVTRMLGSPGNWRISTISDLLAGIAGEELSPASAPIDGHARRNSRHGPDWLDDQNGFAPPKVTPLPAKTTGGRLRQTLSALWRRMVGTSSSHSGLIHR